MTFKTTINKTKGVVTEKAGTTNDEKLVINVPVEVSGTLSINGTVVTASGGGGGNSVSSSAPTGETIWVVTSTTTSSAYPNGLTYIPLIKGNGDSVEFQFTSAISGVLEIQIAYAMSVANSGNVEAKFGFIKVGDGDDPAQSFSFDTAFTFTPGNDTNRHTLKSSNDSSLAITASNGDQLLCKFARTTGSNDTHTGDFRILEIRAKTL